MFGNISMKQIGVIGAIIMLGACASSANNTPIDVDTSPTRSSTTAAPQAGPVAGSQEDLEAAAGNRVFFGYNEWTLTPQAQSSLARQASWMKQYPETRLVIAGNCDERGTREYNLGLGKRRAEAAKAYLVSLGVDRARLVTVSYGKERPLDPRANDSAWSLNRNATTTISGVGA